VKKREETKGVLKSIGEAVSNATTFNNKFTEMDDVSKN
jgi:hypothetical protein